MPYIAFESGALPAELKQTLIERLTEVAAEVTGIPAVYFFVALRELPDENLAIGGTNVRELKAKLQSGDAGRGHQGRPREGMGAEGKLSR